MQDGIDELRE